MVTSATRYYTYDTHRRLMKITRPRGNCLHRSYDGERRLLTVVEGDYNSGSGAVFPKASALR